MATDRCGTEIRGERRAVIVVSDDRPNDQAALGDAVAYAHDNGLLAGLIWTVRGARQPGVQRAEARDMTTAWDLQIVAEDGHGHAAAIDRAVAELLRRGSQR